MEGPAGEVRAGSLMLTRNLVHSPSGMVLYKGEGGKRTPLAPKGTPEKTYGVKHPVPSGVWSTLAVEFRKSLFSVSMNGTQLFAVEDGTFTEAEKIGLWTKADSVTHFDEFAFESI